MRQGRQFPLLKLLQMRTTYLQPPLLNHQPKMKKALNNLFEIS